MNERKIFIVAEISDCLKLDYLKYYLNEVRYSINSREYEFCAGKSMSASDCNLEGRSIFGHGVLAALHV